MFVNGIWSMADLAGSVLPTGEDAGPTLWHFGTLALWHFEWLEVAVAEAAEFLFGLSNGGNGGVVEFGVVLEDADDGLGVDGPEFDVVGNVSRVVGFD